MSPTRSRRLMLLAFAAGAALAGTVAAVRTLAATDPAPAEQAEASRERPRLDAQTCADACALLTRVAYDELVGGACNLCKPYDDTFCEVDFPFSDVPPCEAYDELRNCIYARFGYVFSSPKWQRRFASAPWYKADPTFTDAKLPPVARANVERLKALKAGRQGCE